MLVGLALTASAQKDGDKKPPPKNPPVINPAPPKNPPPDKPKKPGFALVVFISRDLDLTA